MSSNQDVLLREDEAAEILGVKHRSLQMWRKAGTGPRYAKIGKFIRYTRADIDTFVERNMRSSINGNGAA